MSTEANKAIPHTAYRNAFLDLHFTIDEQIAEGNAVVTRWTARGTPRQSRLHSRRLNWCGD